MEHATRSADLAWLCCGPTRGALLSMLSAGARPHQHRDRSVARASNGLTYRVPLPWRAIRAILCRGYSVDRPKSTRRAVRAWHGCVVGQCGARFSPRHRSEIDRTNTATSRWHGLEEVSVPAFESYGAWSARFLPRGVSTDRPRSTSRAVRTWRDCAVGQHEVRTCYRPGLDHINTSTGPWRGL